MKTTKQRSTSKVVNAALAPKKSSKKNAVSAEEPLISIVTPVFDAEKFIAETIQSIQAQTYNNWELILVDDRSSDASVEIIKHFLKKDPRICLIQNVKNQGAAHTRNVGIDVAKGKYLCFIDADDLWRRDKLELQLQFMQEKDCEFSFTGYEFADANGRPNGKKVHVPDTITYKQALKNTTIWTSTVMLNLAKLGKDNVHMPNVRRGQDTATWWKILKIISEADGLDEQLSFYRRTNDSLSSNKIIALKRTWNLYRSIEELNLLSATYNFVWYIYNAVRRRV